MTLLNKIINVSVLFLFGLLVGAALLRLMEMLMQQLQQGQGNGGSSSYGQAELNRDLIIANAWGVMESCVLHWSKAVAVVRSKHTQPPPPPAPPASKQNSFGMQMGGGSDGLRYRQGPRGSSSSSSSSFSSPSSSSSSGFSGYAMTSTGNACVVSN